MIGTLIVTHGGLARELVAAAEVITGGLQNCEAISLSWTEGVEEAREKLLAGVGRLDRGDGVLVLTDMFGDTPSNAAFSIASAGRVEVVTGVNLPMVVRVAYRAAEMTVTDLARWLQLKGRRSIRRRGDGGSLNSTGTIPVWKPPLRGGGAP